MPVQVHVPIRIRLGEQALSNGRDQVEEALAKAAARALQASCDEVLAPRGGYVGVHLHAPTVTWTGAAVALPADAQWEFERRLAEILREVATAQGLLDWARAGENAPRSLPGGASEPVDPDRLVSEVGTYVVPSYRARKRHQSVRVAGSPPPSETMTIWRTISSEGQLAHAVDEELALQGMTLPTSGYFGVIYRHRGALYLRVHRFPEDVMVLWLGPLTNPQAPVIGKRGALTFESRVLSPGDTYEIAFAGVTSNEQQLRSILLEHWGDHLRDQFAKSIEARSPYISRAERDIQLEAAINTAVTAMVKRIPSERTWTCFRIRTTSGKHLLVWSDEKNVPPDLRAVLLPLVREIPRKKAKPPRRAEVGREAAERAARPTAAIESERAPAGTVAGKEPGFVVTEEPGPGRPFPVLGNEVWTETCTAFLGEPSIAELGEDGERLRQLIDQIALKLQIQPCEFAGNFCLNAAYAIELRSVQVGTFAVHEKGITKEAAGTIANLGTVEFVPLASSAIQLLRHLASVTPQISKLSRELPSVYARHADKIRGTWKGRASSWVLRFMPELNLRMAKAIGVLFAATCRVLLLQLLRASAEEIEKRKADLPRIAAGFEAIIVPLLRDLEELKRLRSQLRDALPTGLLETAGGAVYSTWRDARRAIVDAVDLRDPFPGEYRGPGGVIVKADGVTGIRDSSGTVWTVGDLDWTLRNRESIVAELDPVSKQIIDDHTLSRRFLLPNADIETELELLVNEMLKSNAEITAKSQQSWIYAFRASQIDKNLRAATVHGSNFALRGIHLVAHEQISEFFRGDFYYARGINALFGGELGYQDLTAFAEFTALMVLSITCPPAAMALGIGGAWMQREQALERQRIYRSLINPDIVLTRAEAEAELFAAELSLALSFIPGVGSILRAGSLAVRSVLRRGFTAGAGQLIVRYASRRITRQILQHLEHGLIMAIAKEIAEEQVEDLLIGSLLIDPAIQQLVLEFEGEQQRAEGSSSGRGSSGSWPALVPPAGSSEARSAQVEGDASGRPQP